jgi:hypothetical protein
MPPVRSSLRTVAGAHRRRGRRADRPCSWRAAVGASGRWRTRPAVSSRLMLRVFHMNVSKLYINIFDVANIIFDVADMRCWVLCRGGGRRASDVVRCKR